ncbi:hypothetical protein CDEST_01183 [Colletotrichum destructivum]|uniref:Uncharacterized protein n=1 Tax=Colletotrichum destructivum TaxID=34406 RepID=A0AAX4HYZ7_9PEZI|nr:hypothetical protein CDEST_01183 [Colletotrichum destructivum]
MWASPTDYCRKKEKDTSLYALRAASEVVDMSISRPTQGCAGRRATNTCTDTAITTHPWMGHRISSPWRPGVSSSRGGVVYQTLSESETTGERWLIFLASPSSTKHDTFDVDFIVRTRGGHHDNLNGQRNAHQSVACRPPASHGNMAKQSMIRA